MARWLFAVFTPRSTDSSGFHFQSDANLARIVFSEVNAGLLESFLYFEDSREVSFHDSLALFDAAQSCQADTGPIRANLSWLQPRSARTPAVCGPPHQSHPAWYLPNSRTSERWPRTRRGCCVRSSCRCADRENASSPVRL